MTIGPFDCRRSADRRSYGIATMGESDQEYVKRPRSLPAFDGAAFRDLALQEMYAGASALSQPG